VGGAIEFLIATIHISLSILLGNSTKTATLNQDKQHILLGYDFSVQESDHYENDIFKAKAHFDKSIYCKMMATYI
jgi:hypothetical protein